MSLIPALLRPLDRLGRSLSGLMRAGVLAAVLLSAANALGRKFLDLGSNAALEAPAYVFAAVFMLGAGPVLLRNGHVRIDVLASRFGPRTAAGVDLLGLLAVVLPLCVLMVDLALPLLAESLRRGELSQNAGGLPRWPLWALMVAGFAVLGLQALAEALRRLGFLLGALPSPLAEEARSAAAAEAAGPALAPATAGPAGRAPGEGHPPARPGPDGTAAEGRR